MNLFFYKIGGILPLLFFFLVLTFPVNAVLNIGYDNDKDLSISSYNYTYNSNFTNFTQLLDVPNAYTGEGGKCAAVNAGESGLEFINCSSGGSSSFNTSFPITFGNATHWIKFSMTSFNMPMISSNSSYGSALLFGDALSIFATNMGTKAILYFTVGLKSAQATFHSTGEFNFTGANIYNFDNNTKISGNLTAKYKSSDGSVGVTDSGLCTITEIKDGIITRATCV